MPLENKDNCFETLMSIFRIHGINFMRKQSKGRLRWISFARAIVLYCFISGTVFIAFMLSYNLIHRNNISEICLWVSIQSLVIAALFFYIKAWKHQNTIIEFFNNLAEILAMSSDNEAKTKSDFRFIRRLCNWITAIGISVQVVHCCTSVLQSYFGKMRFTVSESVFHFIGHSFHYANFHIYWICGSAICELLTSTFMQLYANMVLVICITLNLCFHNLKRGYKPIIFKDYHYKHQQICELIRQANSLFSVFWFITVIQDVIIIVLLSRMFKNALDIWDNLTVVPLMVQSFLNLCLQTFYASRVNSKVYTSLDTPPSVGSSGDQEIEDHINHLIYVARLSSNKVGLTMWGFFVIGKGLIFTTIGTMVTYIIVLWQFG